MLVTQNWAVKKKFFIKEISIRNFNFWRQQIQGFYKESEFTVLFSQRQTSRQYLKATRLPLASKYLIFYYLIFYLALSRHIRYNPQSWLDELVTSTWTKKITDFSAWSVHLWKKKKKSKFFSKFVLCSLFRKSIIVTEFGIRTDHSIKKLRTQWSGKMINTYIQMSANWEWGKMVGCLQCWHWHLFDCTPLCVKINI